MDGGIVAQWSATAVLGVGLAYTILKSRRNQSRNQTAKSTKMDAELENIKEQITHPDYGLSAIKNAVNDQKLHCARISTSFLERIDAAEEDIKEIKKAGGRG